MTKLCLGFQNGSKRCLKFPESVRNVDDEPNDVTTLVGFTHFDDPCLFSLLPVLSIESSLMDRTDVLRGCKTAA